MRSTKDVISSIIYDADELCCLCFKAVKAAEGNAVRLCDEIYFDGLQNTVETRGILSYILGDNVLQCLSEFDPLCGECTQTAIYSYKFIKMCKDNTKTISSALQYLADSVDYTIDNYECYNTLFLAINTEEGTSRQHYDRQKITNVRSAAKKIRSLMNVKKTKHQSTRQPINVKVPDNIFTTKQYQEYICTVLVEHGRKLYQCKFCSSILKKFSSIEQHYNNLHASSALKNIPTKSKRQLVAEIRSKICYIVKKGGTEKYNCKFCSVSCSTYASVQRHYTRFHGTKTETENESSTKDENVSTEECEMEFEVPEVVYSDEDNDEEPANIKVNKRKCSVIVDDGKEIFECKICQRTFDKYSNLTVHYSICKKSQPKADKIREKYGLVCSTCGREFNNRYVLRKHEETHTRKPMTCSRCKKVYYTEEFYIKHVCNLDNDPLILTADQKKFTCDICKKKFINKPSIRAHIRYNHLEQRATCAWCGKKFGLMSMLKQHMVVHTRERNFKCEVCGKQLVCQSSLKKHSRLHTGEKPYQCQYCKQAFVSFQRRTEHIRSKHMDPSFECTICHKMFQSHQVMRKHRNRHFNPNSRMYVSTLKKKVKYESYEY